MMFSETDIRTAWAAHHQSNDGCTCSWRLGGNNEQEFSIDHFIDVLKAQPGRAESISYPIDDNGHRCPMELRRPW